MKAQTTTQEIAGGEIMKKITCTALNKAVWLIVVVLVLLLSQARVQGATDCVNDRDCDGLLDTEEPFTIDGVTTNPDQPDLFVIFEPLSSGSLMPNAPLSTLINSAQLIGLSVHQISGDQVLPGTVRNVTSTQRAVRIVENSYPGTNLGQSPVGNPDSTDETAASTIFTQTITNTVAGLCTPPKGKAPQCQDSVEGNIGQQAVIDKYIGHTIAHEVGHQLNLKYTCSPDVGCHYPQITDAAQTPTILDQSAFYIKGRSAIIWYIGSIYNPADANFQLIP
jgi:hypothetical protein